MACFTVPATEAIITTVVEKIIKNKATTAQSESPAERSSDTRGLYEENSKDRDGCIMFYARFM